MMIKRVQGWVQSNIRLRRSHGLSPVAILNFSAVLLIAVFFAIAPVAIGQQAAGGSCVPLNLAANPPGSGALSDMSGWAAGSGESGYVPGDVQNISGNQSGLDHGLGYMPAQVHVSAARPSVSLRMSLRSPSYPATYDLRTIGQVTSVKDQGTAGTCWAFAAYGSLESTLMPAENRDFSESNMKNLAGFDNEPNNGGGDMYMATAYLVRWAGPVNETDDPYSYSETSPAGLTVQKHVQDVIMLPIRSGPLDNNAIKSALMGYGGVWASMYWKGSSYNAAWASYYYNNSMGDPDGGHAVTIVGWDDNYDCNRFSNQPPGNGAFIAKNSWGTGWGDNGYFYVSYYDSTFADDTAVFLAEPASNYDYIYQYDPLGWTYNLAAYYSNSAWFANVFTAGPDETLKAVGFYVPEQASRFDVYVYNETGLIASRTGISNPSTGYHTFPLDAPVTLTAGERFSVEVKVDGPETDISYVCVEMPQSGYSSKAIANDSEGFVSTDGAHWQDVNQLFPGTSVCLKAYTVNSQSLQFGVTDCEANRNAGTVTLTLTKSGSTGQTASVSYSTANGTAVAEKDFVAKSGQVTFQPSDTSKTITIDILDAQSYVDRQFSVNLSNPVNAVIGAGASAMVTVRSSHKPIQIVNALPMQGADQTKGGVSGRVTLNTSAGIGLANAYVAIVNACNTSQAYGVSQTDSDGYFQFTGINHTWDVSANAYLPIYRLYVNQTQSGECYSNNFSVCPGATAAANAIITAMPAHITLIAANSTIVANASDNATISAYVIDAFNYPVVDGASVTFTMAGNNAGYGQFGPYAGTVPAGSSITATTVNGYARARFGWATSTGTTTIKASWAEDSRINATGAESLIPVHLHIDLVPGWNLISVPLTLQDNSLSAIFPADVMRNITDIWGWDGSAQNWVYYSDDSNDYFYKYYPKVARLETGRAYWVRMTGSGSVDLQGAVPSYAPASSVAFVYGWNFVGITGVSPALLTSMYPAATDVWGWNEAAQNWVYYSDNPDDYFYQYYPKLTSVTPGDGYWVRIA